MLAASAIVFALSWWLGLYLFARDPRKPVLVLAGLGLMSFASVVAVDATRVVSGASALGGVEVFLVTLPGIAWLAVLLEMARPSDAWGGRSAQLLIVGAAAAIALFGAAMAGDVDGPLRPGHVVMLGAIAGPSFAALVRVLATSRPPRRIISFVVVATLFFALGNVIIVIPLELVPSWLAFAGTGFDIAVLGVAVAMSDAFDEGQALGGDMLRSFAAMALVSLLFGGQTLIGLAITGRSTALTVMLFTSLAIAIAVQVLAGPLAGLLDRLAFARSPALRADRDALRRTEAALPRRASSPLDDVDDEAFVRLTRRALAHYNDLSRLVASPLTALPVIDDRLAARDAPDQPLERANELRALLAEHIERLKPRDAGEFGTTEPWRYYNSLQFPYVVGVRAYAQNSTAAGLDPVARQAWQWLVTEVPQRSLHNWQNAAARLIAVELRGELAVLGSD
ncbi:MAG TPA: hypothetical protein VM093_09790 [Aeromicrobium sp.]|nr:hypothetical protein [Aeromicrobium sp.]